LEVVCATAKSGSLSLNGLRGEIPANFLEIFLTARKGGAGEEQRERKTGELVDLTEDRTQSK
jgi:hypothetical protein